MLSLKNFLKSFKPAHVLYNFFHRKQLEHNRLAYTRYGIKKPLYWSVSSKDFANLPQTRPWLDLPDAKNAIPLNPDFEKFPVDIKNQVLNWPEKGYLVLERFFSENEVDAVNTEMERLLRDKLVEVVYKVKVMFAFRQSEAIRKMTFDSRLGGVMNFLLGAKMIPFQTINFLRGTQQKAHSDYIHMATYPAGYLSAAWIALEDINENNGPLFYYPGSHKMPYLLNDNFDHGGSALTIGKKAYESYEKTLDEALSQSGLKTEVIYPKKGDVFVWHGNLVHGGMPILNPALTRKSMVIHYFGQDTIKYHEITQRPALMEM